jgi:hypothetical protein
VKLLQICNAITIAAPPTSIGTRPYIESVVLTIPYYIDASKTITKTDGSREYTLTPFMGLIKRK